MPTPTKTELESPSVDHIQAMEMLTQGRGLAFQLRDLLQEDRIPISGDRLVLAEDLLEKIHGSFTDSISALCDSFEIISEESGESSTFAKTRKAASHRKRREMSEGHESWTEITSSLVNDGLAWRKYGQKSILNAKHSRNYYRCTHKDHLGCPAKKHVQQMGDNPLSYRTVYSFRHTCTMITNARLNPPAEAAQMIYESAAQPDMNLSSSFIFNFQSKQHDSDRNNQNNDSFISSEFKEEHIVQNYQIDDYLTLLNSTNNMGSSSDVGRDVSHASFTLPDACTRIDEFMNFSINHSPHISKSKDAEDPWFY